MVPFAAETGGAVVMGASAFLLAARADAVLGCRLDHSIHVQLVARPAQQNAPGRVPDDIDVGIADGA